VYSENHRPENPNPKFITTRDIYHIQNVYKQYEILEYHQEKESYIFN
jgi:hypothetical protein